MSCTCGCAFEEHGHDPDYPGSSACTNHEDCVAYESDGRDAPIVREMRATALAEKRARRDRPVRIQLSRKKGFKLPEGAVVVARPTKWGNPFKIGALAREDAIAWFSAALATNPHEPYRTMRADIGELRGKVLACWCKTTELCHADVLAEYANKETP